MKTLGIVGTGLIGASIGMRARRNSTYVLGFDIDRGAAERALSAGAIDKIVDRESLYKTCDGVAIAAPIAATCNELRRLQDGDEGWDLLIDVASVKRPVVTAAAGVANFVATHPLAGNEGTGSERATPDLFEGRTWAYVRSGNGQLDARAEALVRSLGGRPFAIDAAAHDALVALTSHLPQLLATILSRQIAQMGDMAEMLCGPAGLEVLRLGRSNPRLWREIFEANADALASAGACVAEELARECASFEAAGRAVDGAKRP